MNDTVNYFFELIQIGIGQRTQMSAVLSDDQWKEVCKIAGKQSLLGVAFAGLDRLPKEQCPSKRPMMWMYDRGRKIKAQNDKFNDAAPKIVRLFEDAGFRGVILKGQGLARLYDDPGVRSPGDIDIWLDGKREDIIKFVRSRVPDAKVCYHHIDCGKIDGVEVEAHFTPTWMFNPLKNSFFQKWSEEALPRLLSNRVEIGGEALSVPDLEFDRVFVLLHIYRHLFTEGVGLRQLMDYYYVLKKGFTEKERNETLRVIDALGMRRFTASVMYVLQKVFLMNDNFLLVPANESEGEFLLSEILRAGNFGQYDERNAHGKNEGELRTFIRKMLRISRFTIKYPSEVLWSPFFKIWQFFWRKTR